MLTNCKECGGVVSDKAACCPHCGCPTSTVTTKIRRSTPRRMKLPNGFGQISEIKGNLRNPFRVMVTTGFDTQGKPISKILKPTGYFKTYNEAYEALMEYHRNPYDLSVTQITMDELYKKWFEERAVNKAATTTSSYKLCWRYCSEIHNLPVVEIKPYHIKKCVSDGTIIDRGSVHHPTLLMQQNIKKLINMLLDYAIEYSIIDRNYSRMMKLSQTSDKKSTNSHITFTDEEMTILWNNSDDSMIKMILIQCYMGWRPLELVNITINDVFLSERYIIGGCKTENGINRKVPIHSKIYAIVECLYDKAIESSSEYLFEPVLIKSTTNEMYNAYRKRFPKLIAKYNMNPNHRPHDPRKQFVTMCKKCHVDEYAIKRLAGHAITDLTERVYTERGLDWLSSEIEKIK